MVLDKPGGLIHFVPMKPAKAMTIRLSEEQAEALETVANVEQRAVSDVIRAAINEHIESRRKDPSFQEDLRRGSHARGSSWLGKQAATRTRSIDSEAPQRAAHCCRGSWRSSPVRKPHDQFD